MQYVMLKSVYGISGMISDADVAKEEANCHIFIHVMRNYFQIRQGVSVYFQVGNHLILCQIIICTKRLNLG